VVSDVDANFNSSDLKPTTRYKYLQV